MESLSLETGEPHARAEWEKLAADVLRKSGRIGADDADAEVWAKLTRRTLDGLEVSPLGSPELTRELTTAGRPPRSGDWDNRAFFDDSDVTATREALLTDLENGATSVWLRLGRYGVPLDGLTRALEPVSLEAAAVVLEAPDDQLEAARAFAALAQGRDLAAGTNLGLDPVGAAVRSGGFETPTESSGTRELVGSAGRLATELGCLGLVADGTVVHDLGASDVQEIGYAVAVAAHYLRELVEAGHDTAEAAGLIEFRLAATDEQFPTIAKLRAVRRLWARVLELSGVAEERRTMRLHAVTSRPMMSKYDPWVNMLRTCIAAFSAGVAGADAVTVLPFDARLGLPDAFSRRIARNTSTLLLAESHIGAVADPAGGSHVVERLTDDLANAGWDELGRIDGKEGSLSGLAALGARVADVVAERDRHVATRKRPLTGLTEFPNLHETLPERPARPAGGVQVRPYGEAFEALRDEPAASPVFLATMGTVAAHTARASFATNLFAAGGIDVVNEGPHEDVEAVLAHHDRQPVVCLVGTDGAYAEWGTSLVKSLREAGARWVIVAGPDKWVAALEGCDDNCAMGVDALDFLTRTRTKLEEGK